MVGRTTQDIAEAVPSSVGRITVNDVATRDSAMVIDIDQLSVRAVLFDLVDGAPRFVGIGTSVSANPGEPVDSEHVSAAVRDLEEQAGRRLMAEERLISPQFANGDGVDEVLFTGLPVPLNRAAVISIGNGGLGRKLVGGIRQSPTVMAFASEDLGPGSGPLNTSTLLSWLRDISPKTLIMVHDGGTAEDWDIAIEAASDAVRDGAMTTGIVIADESRQQLVAQSLGMSLELSGIDPLEYEPWEIATALESEFVEQYQQRVKSSTSIPSLSTARFIDRLRSMQSVASFLHRRMRRNVIALNIGTGSMAYRAASGGGVTTFRAERDLSLGSRSLLRIAPERISRWLPHRWSSEEITQWILNRSLRPFGLPDSTTDNLVESAVLRELVDDLVQELGTGDRTDVDLVVVGSSFADRDPAISALTVLDGIAPVSADGVVTIALDAEGIMSAIGAISTFDPLFARDVIEQDFLVPLATCVVVTGNGEKGALAVRGEIKVEGGETQRFSVPFGNIHLLHVGESEAADITLTPESGFAIGGRNPGEAAQFTGDRKLFGGRVGIIIDARGRPIQIPDDPEARVAQVRSWLSDAGIPTD